MRWNILKGPLGMGDMSGGYAPSKKEVLPLAVPLAMGAASLASSIFGGISSSKAQREAQRQLEAEKRRVELERQRRLNEDYLDTAAGQNLLRAAREERDRMWRREAGAAAVGGGTDASVAMAKEAGNRMIGDTVANIAAQDAARKDSIDASYRADLSRLNQQQMAAKQAESQAIAQAASGASDALMGGALATFGGTKLGQSLLAPSSGEVSVGSGGGAPAQTPSGVPVSYSPKMLDMVGGWNSTYSMLPWKNLYSFYHPNR